jgi:hypothetical protein
MITGIGEGTMTGSKHLKQSLFKWRGFLSFMVFVFHKKV